jgi:hypothetical protein
MDEDLDHFAIDLPNVNNLDGPWEEVASFLTRDEAIAWAKENLGADDDGRISVISELKP